MKRQVTEPDLDSLLVRHLLALSSRLAEEATTLDDWLAMPPIILDVSDETEALPPEDAFERESGAVRTVCHRPYTRLRTVEETLPTSRVRSIAVGAAARLAARPEDWVSHTLAGVRPRRLLARRSEEDVDIYENRVAVAVLNVMRSHLQQRIAKLRDLSRMVGDVHGLLMPSEGSSWRARRDLTGLLRNIEDSSRHQEAAEIRLRRLESSLAAVEIMLSSPLACAVDHRSAPPRDLHPTNLLSSDPHYRRVALLWQACTAMETVRPGAAETERSAADRSSVLPSNGSPVSFCFLPSGSSRQSRMLTSQYLPRPHHTLPDAGRTADGHLVRDRGLHPPLACVACATRRAGHDRPVHGSQCGLGRCGDRRCPPRPTACQVPRPRRLSRRTPECGTRRRPRRIWDRALQWRGA
ncbi:DUF2357 domain-containing protein [Streptomyces decoyicus]|uniref:DUF2357 domain-containing protein n=1 Tax=Streptomyces decoyicus TaxID=249567 RepID=UPI003629A719